MRSFTCFKTQGLVPKLFFFRRSYDSQWKTVSSFAKETKGFTVSNWNNSTTMYGIPNLQQKTCPPFMHADRTGEEHPIYSQKWFVQQSRKSQEIIASFPPPLGNRAVFWSYFVSDINFNVWKYLPAWVYRSLSCKVKKNCLG